jgi:hypothetical protein
MNGLHSCKPGNEPVIGQVKTFMVEQRTGKSGKAYTKITSKAADQGGQPYKILSARPTGHTDSYGNHSFNIEVEPVNGAHPMGPSTSLPPQQQRQSLHNGDDRSSRIERQHSQSAAIAYCAVKGEIPATDELRKLIDWFERDIEHSVKLRPPAPKEPEARDPSDDEEPF